MLQRLFGFLIILFAVCACQNEMILPGEKQPTACLGLQGQRGHGSGFRSETQYTFDVSDTIFIDNCSHEDDNNKLYIILNEDTTQVIEDFRGRYKFNIDTGTTASFKLMCWSKNQELYDEYEMVYTLRYGEPSWYY